MGRFFGIELWAKCSLAAFMVMAVVACGQVSNTDAESAPTFHAEADPVKLSDWGLLSVSTGSLSLTDRVLPYDLATPLFTDYAHKLRTIWMPRSAEPGSFRGDGVPDMPVGTVISKTFYYPLADQKTVLKSGDASGLFNPLLADLDQVLLMETRLLVKRDAGWVALSYVWDADQQDATLTKIGAVKPLSIRSQDHDQSFPYIVPNTNQCAGCHAPNATTKELVPLGIHQRHLNKAYLREGVPENQLVTLENAGFMKAVDNGEAPRNADWLDQSISLDARARSYLDINCSHCHNPKGPADTSGLDLTVDAPFGEALGVCKLPIAAGLGTGGRRHDIVPGDADQSILSYRMETTNPAAMMPELGRSLAHREGVGLINQWIDAMDGGCGDT